MKNIGNCYNHLLKTEMQENNKIICFNSWFFFVFQLSDNILFEMVDFNATKFFAEKRICSRSALVPTIVTQFKANILKLTCAGAFMFPML